MLTLLRRSRLTAVAFAGAIPVLVAACAFDARIAVLRTAEPGLPYYVRVAESFTASVETHVVTGRTTRAGQIVGIDCSNTLFYDVNEATGSTVLSQPYAVRLHTGRLQRGTAYRLSCTDPLIVELPELVTAVNATATSTKTHRTFLLPVVTPAASIPLAFGRRLQADRGTVFAVVRWALPSGDYRMSLGFDAPAKNRTIREKALYAASVSCGGARYLQPVLPIATSMAGVQALRVPLAARSTSVTVPRIAQSAASVALSCG